MTWRELAYDIIATFGTVHDDMRRSEEAILFQIQLAANRLRRQRLEKEVSMSGDRGSTDTLTTFIVPLFQETYLNGRTYFKLPAEVYDIKQNQGISYIVYHRDSGCQDNLVGRHFTLCTPAEVDILSGSAFQKPRPTHPYYYIARLNNGQETFSDRVWLLGLSPLIRSVEVGLYLTLDLSDPMFDPDVDADLPADQIYLIKRMVLDLERWAYVMPEDLKNDGRDRTLGRPVQAPPPMMSINDVTTRSDT